MLQITITPSQLKGTGGCGASAAFCFLPNPDLCSGHCTHVGCESWLLDGVHFWVKHQILPSTETISEDLSGTH